MTYDPHTHQRFCNVSWLERWDTPDNPTIMTMNEMRADGSWELYSVGPLGVVHVEFAEAEGFFRQMEAWVEAMKKSINDLKANRKKLGLETT